MTHRILSAAYQVVRCDTCLLLADTNLNSLLESMSNELINLCHWCKANELSVNTVKPSAMIISSKQCSTYSATPLLYDEVPIKIVDEFKYLGVILNSKFDFYAHRLYNQLKTKFLGRLELLANLNTFFLLTLYSNYIPMSYMDSLFGDPHIKHT